MDALPRKYLTEEEYLAIERAAQWKSEYYQGEMFAMAGGSEAHSLIAMNLGGEIREALRSKPCRVYNSDLRVQVDSVGLYTYPDLSIVSGQPQFAEEQKDNLLNPVVIIEILSPSTEAYGRGKKFDLYQQLRSLKEYILVAQDRVSVISYVRNDDAETWTMRSYWQLQDVLTIASCNATVPLAEIYRDVPNVESLPLAG
ncbi:MAG: Uma2 family endonuclease [Chlorobi bacterium]|nr:Uma2 family endonuclease [Chlorobiota bacterium]MBX7215987.1 Uma2 family endonuclease [Candidatus Kapabacteria bacterium]